jgi:quercetin dioxygenase-like cupin family protein
MATFDGSIAVQPLFSFSPGAVSLAGPAHLALIFYIFGRDPTLVILLSIVTAGGVVAVAIGLAVIFKLLAALRYRPSGKQCPRCHSSDLRPSWPSGILDMLLRAFSCFPYRCRACRFRYYRFREADDLIPPDAEEIAAARPQPAPPPVPASPAVPADRVIAIDSGALPWEERFNEKLGRSLYRKNLITDPDTGMEVRLVRYPAGVVNPRHTHPCAHGMYVLEGTLFTQSGTYGPGSFVWFPEGNVMEHGSANNQDVTVLFITNKPFEIHYR